MPGFIGFPELLLLGLVALVLFGPKRLPEMGRGLGKGLREFKDSVSGDKPNDNVHELGVASDMSAYETPERETQQVS
jgi:sec-independent protein translocase protein TatA